MYAARPRRRTRRRSAQERRCIEWLPRRRDDSPLHEVRDTLKGEAWVSVDRLEPGDGRFAVQDQDRLPAFHLVDQSAEGVLCDGYTGFFHIAIIVIFKGLFNARGE